MDWQDVWRNHIAKLLPLEGLRNLADAIEHGDDNRLIRGKTTDPPFFGHTSNWPCDCGCPISYTYLSLHDDATVGEVQEFFSYVLDGADSSSEIAYSCQDFLSWVDSADDEKWKSELLPLVRESIKAKESEYVGV